MIMVVVAWLCALSLGCASYPQKGQYPMGGGQNYPSTGVYDGGQSRQRPPFYGPLRYPENSESKESDMKTVLSWKQLDFTFPSDEERERMIRNSQFIPINNLILDTEVYNVGSVEKTFITLPRVRPGVPVTLATVSNRRKNGEYLLEPFPNWEAHNALNQGNCNDGITSVFRIHIDECDRLWVLDSGSINAFTGNASIACQPKVWIFDLKDNNRLIGKYPIPQSMIAANSLLVTIVVDIRREQCENAFAYIADAIAYKMIVFDLRNTQFWRINSIMFQAFPDQSRFLVNGETFELFGGIFGLALGPLHKQNKRILYFHCIDSVKQAWVDTDDLRNRSLWMGSMNAKPQAFNLFNGSRPSQSAAAAINEQGIMFFGLASGNELACWNTQFRFSSENILILAKDDVRLQFVSGIKAYQNDLYTVTGRLQNYLNNKVNKDEVNYRVLKGDLRLMTQGTSCTVDVTYNRFNEDNYQPNMEGDILPENLKSY